MWKVNRDLQEKAARPKPCRLKMYEKNYLALAAFHSAIFARTSALMHQMKVKQQKEPRAATAGKPQTIILMPLMVDSA